MCFLLYTINSDGDLAWHMQKGLESEEKQGK
jgi:hypothetical protein